MEIPFCLWDNDAMDDGTVGWLIRRHRNAAGLTQKKLGEAIDKSDRIVSEWETGRGAPGRDAIDAMAQFFRISADEFFRRMRPEQLEPELDALLIEAREQKQNDGHAVQRQRVALVAEQLIDHPDLLDEWLRYGAYLLCSR